MQIAIRYILAFVIIFGILAVVFSDTHVKRQFSTVTNNVVENVKDLYPNRSCAEPLAYSLGEIDPRFGLTESEVTELLAESENIWEEASSRDLFIYAPDSEDSVKVNFIFDERQADIIAARSSEASINSEWEAFDRLVEEYEVVSSDYETRTSVYEAHVGEYEDLLNEFNQAVEEWNEDGGSRGEYDELKEQEFFIKTVFQGLEEERQSLNQVANNLNKLADQINSVQRQLNRKTDLHNHEFATEEVVNSGDYFLYEINIYQYHSLQDLKLTLAHELGHALGIDHLEDPESIMHYLLDEQDVLNISPSEADLEALIDICGTI